MAVKVTREGVSLTLQKDKENGGYYVLKGAKGQEVREEFKFNFTDNTTYTGVDAQERYESIILASPTVKNTRMIINVKNKKKIPRIDWGDNILQDDSCSFTAGAGPILSQRTIEVVYMKINEGICVQELEDNYISEQLSASANDVDFVPADIQDYLVRRLVNKAADTLENIIINGNTAGVGSVSLFDGLRKLAGADPLVVHVDQDGATIQVNTIIDEISRIYFALPDEISGEMLDVNGNMVTAKIWVSIQWAKFYRVANASDADQKYIFPMANGQLNFLGIPLITTTGLSKTKTDGKEVAFATDSENIWFGTGDPKDWQDISILPQADKSGDDEVRFKGRMSGGVNYAIPQYFVLYWDGTFTGVYTNFPSGATVLTHAGSVVIP